MADSRRGHEIGIYCETQRLEGDADVEMKFGSQIITPDHAIVAERSGTGVITMERGHLDNPGYKSLRPRRIPRLDHLMGVRERAGSEDARLRGKEAKRPGLERLQG